MYVLYAHNAKRVKQLKPHVIVVGGTCMSDLWNRWNGQGVENRNRASHAEGHAKLGREREKHSPTTWKGRPVYPVSKTEMDPFARCCED